MRKWAIAGALLAGLLILMMGCTTPPPIVIPPPTLTGVAFSWALSAPIPATAQCTTPVTTTPCARYVLSDGAAAIAYPAIEALSYVLKPLPAAGAHNYSLVMEIVSNDGSIRSSLVPALKTVVIP